MIIKKTSSSIDAIKYLAIFSMLIDHCAIVFFNNDFILRCIGRFAYVGFSFLIAYNYRYHTKNKKEYKQRLFIWAIISQIPYYLVFPESGGNIMFLLLMGLLIIDITQQIANKAGNSIIQTIAISTIFLSSIFFSYFFFGVLTIVLFYYSFENKYVIFPLLISVFLMNFDLYYGVSAILGLLLIYLIRLNINIYRINKFYFYAFYPLHLLVIWIIDELNKLSL